MSKRRGPGPHVDWAGVVVRLSDGRTVALEFDGTTNFVTADIHTVKPWDAISRNKFQDEVHITIHGNGRVWTEGAGMAPAARKEIESPQRALEGEISAE